MGTFVTKTDAEIEEVTEGSTHQHRESPMTERLIQLTGQARARTSNAAPVDTELKPYMAFHTLMGLLGGEIYPSQPTLQRDSSLPEYY